MQIEDVSRLRFRDGDVVLVEVPEGTEDDQMRAISDEVRSLIPRYQSTDGGIYTEPDVHIIVTPYRYRVLRNAAGAAESLVREECDDADDV